MSRRTRLSVSWFFASLAVLGAGLTSLAGYEAYAVASGIEPVTDYVKNEIREKPVLATVIFAAVFILVGHFWTSAPAEVEP